MSVIVLDNKRLFLKRIKNYELNSEKIYYRNDKAEERFLFLFLMNEDELWSEYKFKYLYIQMFDGSEYKYFSDKKLYRILKKMDEYFKEAGISEIEDCSYNSSEDCYYVSEDLKEIMETDEHLAQAIDSYVIIKDTFIFVDEDISIIADRMDNSFGTL
ncbi:DNA polymerase III subunit alpha [Solibacillus isronensis]|uniref:DNA polymerase III subunit alpha n=1 Tax=Solibacillus isronensis TaxID=412383 RepID=UPI00203DEDC1|nr:DNA polymerase III subunit alpha [Solibacillus isronensis]MCM3720925.1 DNA polymerase III subunit alpha [Solibacillus isronensis]